MRRILVAVFLLVLVALPVLAQDGGPKEQLTKELWCPICNGIRLDVCEQKVCEQMRDMIDQELAAGKTPEQIKADFIDLYGPVVLGEPPRQGFDLIAWIVPVVLLVGGVLAIGFMIWRWSKRSTSMRMEAAASAASAASSPPAGSGASTAPLDPYLSRVERELSEQ